METATRVLPSHVVGVDAEQLNSALDRLDALPVVSSSRIDESHNNGVGRVVANLWCAREHAKKDRQPYVCLNAKAPTDPTAVPSYLMATTKLISKIEQEHCGCLAAAEAAKQADTASTASSSAPNVTATEAMMRLEAARARARAANAAALEAEKHKDACEEEVEALRAVLDPKRPRLNAEAAAADDDGPVHTTADWDLADHRREMSRVTSRRAIEVGSVASAHEPRTGKNGYLHLQAASWHGRRWLHLQEGNGSNRTDRQDRIYTWRLGRGCQVVDQVHRRRFRRAHL
jgi:hypothetical protein